MGFVCGFFIGHFFMVMLDVATDAIFICYLVDLQMNNGEGVSFGTKGLQKVFKSTRNAVHKEKKKEREEGKKGRRRKRTREFPPSEEDQAAAEKRKAEAEKQKAKANKFKGDMQNYLG